MILLGCPPWLECFNFPSTSRIAIQHKHQLPLLSLLHHNKSVLLLYKIRNAQLSDYLYLYLDLAQKAQRSGHSIEAWFLTKALFNLETMGTNRCMDWYEIGLITPHIAYHMYLPLSLNILRAYILPWTHMLDITMFIVHISYPIMHGRGSWYVFRCWNLLTSSFSKGWTKCKNKRLFCTWGTIIISFI